MHGSLGSSILLAARASSLPHGPPPSWSDTPRQSSAGQAHRPPGASLDQFPTGSMLFLLLYLLQEHNILLYCNRVGVFARVARTYNYG
ncbi:unnamed protein product [Triticum turgidum subsp. durum]|uniref:Uncharacterized protein n=1 Tax=Triticum turgidum subsp. durum TaxID=4567 RepID=A0A9R0SVI5_TRITD|nr:unnamed protein product [Triticum turgidum subsp. durum]